jgi:hypothetical protein
MKLHFTEWTFSFELLYAASYAPHCGLGIGEVLATANRIDEGDFESWSKEDHTYIYLDKPKGKQLFIVAVHGTDGSSAVFRFFLPCGHSSPPSISPCKGPR